MARVVLHWIVATVALVLWPGAAWPQDADLKKAIESLRASSAELRREEAAYRTALQASKIKGSEQADYAEFVAGLRLRVLQQCENVRALGGQDAVHDIDCARPSSQVAAAVLPPARAPLTDEEKRSALGARLDELEDNIDESLLKRQQEIRQTGTRASGAGGGSGSGAQAGGGAGASGAQGAGTAAGSAGKVGTQSGSSGPPDSGDKAGASERPGSTAQAGQSPPSAASASAAQHQVARANDGGVDDDVVARQLREAAERETDPVLKDKLWAEYKKYKEAKR